jgi:uDENN domain/Putative GTPase activating protein for Arf
MIPSLQSRPPDRGGGGVTKLLTQFLSVPSNRSCADCKSALVDASQIYVSFRPPPSFSSNDSTKPRELGVDSSIRRNDQSRRSTSTKRRIPSFSQQHNALRPSAQAEGKDYDVLLQQQQHQHIIPVLPDDPVDPAVAVPLAHGVLVCALCGAAHKLLRASTTTVRSVLDRSAWTTQEVQFLLEAQGNHVATLVYEAYWRGDVSTAFPRPTASSTVAGRLVFCRAKYEALAFCLPPPGPLAAGSWQRLRELHPEWEGLWGADWCDDLDLDLNGRLPSTRSDRGDRDSNGVSNEDYLALSKNGSASSILPDRLIDYFCVVTASDYLHPSLCHQNLTNTAPEDFFLTPKVTDCIPTPDSYQHDAFENSRFPEHVSTFVFPDGCAPSLVPLPPQFFTLVLTNASGERLYGAVLRLYDDSKDTVETVLQILRNSQYPRDQYPSWLPSRSKGATSPQTSDQEVLFFPKCLVVLSHYPFFDLFRKFLLQIYRIALTEAPLPMERFVVNFGTCSHREHMVDILVWSLTMFVVYSL